MSRGLSYQSSQKDETISRVEEVLRGSLELDSNRDAIIYSSLERLGMEDTDLIDIFHKLGLHPQEYFCGGALSKQGRECLLEIARKEYWNRCPETAEHFRSLANTKSVDDFIKMSQGIDLVHILRYQDPKKSTQ